MKILAALLAAVLLFSRPHGVSAEYSASCRSLDEQPVKVEAWLAKKYKPRAEMLAKEFEGMGYTRATLWFYPAGENPSGTIAIGKCVPAYIAQYLIRMALEYTAGVSSLIHQGIVAGHWTGLGLSLFDEKSLRPITREQLLLLRNENLSTPEFHALYRKFSGQIETLQLLGVNVPHPRRLTDE